MLSLWLHGYISESFKMPLARGTRPKSIEIFLKRVIPM